MTLLRFDPIRGFETMARKMSEIAGEVEKGISFEFGSFVPRVDISEDDKGLNFNVELPGVFKEDVKLSINDENVLVIKGFKKKKENEQDQEASKVRVERTFGDFMRSFMLPDNINTDSISARFENGVLEVKLEKKEPEKPKEKEINID